eukprot:gene35387-42892_t
MLMINPLRVEVTCVSLTSSAASFNQQQAVNKRIIIEACTCNSPKWLIMIAHQHSVGSWGSHSNHRLSSSSSCSSSPRATRRNMLNQFISYLILLLDRVEGTHSDTLILELKDALNRMVLYVPRENCSYLSEADRRLIQDVESRDYDELKGLLEEIVHKTAKNYNALERELKCDRFITAYCSLKTLNDQVEEANRQRYQLAKNEIMLDLLDFDQVFRPSKKVYIHSDPSAGAIRSNNKTVVNAKLFLPTR